MNSGFDGHDPSSPWNLPPSAGSGADAVDTAHRWASSRAHGDLIELAARLPTSSAVTAAAEALGKNLLEDAAGAAHALAKSESDLLQLGAVEADPAAFIALNRFLLAYVEVFAVMDRLIALRNLGHAHLAAARISGDDAEAHVALDHLLTVAAAPDVPARLAERVALDIAAAMLQSASGNLGPFLDRLDLYFAPLAERIAATSGQAANLFSGLGILAFAHWEAGQDPSGLDSAATWLNQAVARADPDGEHFPGIASNFAVAQMMQAQTAGDPKMVTAVIETLQQAAHHMRAGHPLYAKIQMNLASALESRSWSYTNSGDAKAAREAATRALDATRARLARPTHSPADLREFARYAHQFLERFPDSDQTAAIEAELRQYETVWADALKKRPDISGHVDNLRGAILQRRATRHRNFEDLASAAALIKRAADMATSNTEALARVRRLGQIQEQIAILAPSWETWLALADTAQRALDLAGRLSPTESCVELHNCSHTWVRVATWHIDNGGDPSEVQDIIDASLTFALEAASRPGLSAYRRLENAEATAIALQTHWPGQAAPVWEQAALLLPSAAPWFLAPTDRERVLERFGYLPAFACEALLTSNQPNATTRAFQLLNACSFVLVGSHQRLRSTRRQLQRHPDLRERFEPLIQQLLEREAWGRQPTAALQHRFRLQQDLETLERELAHRAVPIDLREDETTAPTQTAPLTVHLLAGASNLFALIDRPVPAALSLPATAPELKTVARRVFTIAEADAALPAPAPGEPPELLDALRWIGDRVVGPVLDECGLEPEPAGVPHVHWIPHGDFAALPLHAAILPSPQHLPGTQLHYAIDHFLFTYGYTSAAAAGIDIGSEPPRSSLLLVGSTTTKLARLPAVDAELTAVKAALEWDEVFELRGADLTTAEALQALLNCRVLHWAGHSELDPTHPSAHGLEVADGHLTLGQVMQLPLEDLRLANLSACQTTVNGTGKLKYESLSLASGFHMAGAERVVGTLWSVYDEAALRFNNAFYRHLRDDQGQIFLDSAPMAVREAILGLRENASLEAKPEVWAAFLLYTSAPK
jgi:hypothetical protein